MKVLYFKKKWAYTTLVCLAILVGGWYYLSQHAIPTFSGQQDKNYTIHMVTGEFKSKTEDGKEIESYRWDPGTIHVPKNQEITLSIYGVNGHEHPFYIEGTKIKGTVKKGQETLVTVKFAEAGVYRLICEAHQDPVNNGPMIAYIVVN